MIATVLESVERHVAADGRTRAEYRLRGNSAGYWIERRRSAFMVDRVMQTYVRVETLWVATIEEAAARFVKMPGVA